jgi:hypothetical protein
MIEIGQALVVLETGLGPWTILETPAEKTPSNEGLDASASQVKHPD